MDVKEAISSLEKGNLVAWAWTVGVLLLFTTAGMGVTRVFKLRGLALVVAFLGLLLLYVLTQFSGLDSPEAMDYAQLGRSLARGEGWHTQFVRPLALAMLRDREYQQSHRSASPTEKIPAVPVNFGKFSDTFSPPLYPLVLSLGFRLAGNPFEAPIDLHIYTPEYVITLLNVLFFLGSGILVYLLAERLFDIRVATLSTLLFFACELNWQFAISGLSTSWTTLLLLGSIFCLHEAMQTREEERPSEIWPWILSSALLLGLGTLSRYSLLWLIPFFLATIALAFRPQPWLWPVAALILALVFLPWTLHNLALTGSPLGQSPLLLGLQTADYPGTTLLRSYRLDGEALLWKESARKILHGSKFLLSNGLSQFGFNLAAPFFLVSFLHLYRRPRANYLRLFILGGGLGLYIGSCLVDPSPEPLSENNQLVLFAPLITIFGTAFIFILLDRWSETSPLLQNACLAGLFTLQISYLSITLLLHEGGKFSYPPYFPPFIALTGQWLDKDEVNMSDIPWACAWYGDRSSIWLTSTLTDYYEINDYVSKSFINTILLTPETSNSRLLSELKQGEWKEWLPIINQTGIPANFPLKYPLTLAPQNIDYLFLSDRVRWR